MATDRRMTCARTAPASSTPGRPRQKNREGKGAHWLEDTGPCGASAARAISHQTAGRIIFPPQRLGDPLAVRRGMFRARRVEQIHADGLTGLRRPILAALVVSETHPLIGARPHIDDTEDRRPGLTSFGDDRKDNRDLVGPYFGCGNGKRSGEQIRSELKTHFAKKSQPFEPASVTPRSSCSPRCESLRRRA